MENFQKEIKIKKKLLEYMSLEELERRYLFANEEQYAITTLEELQKRDPEVAEDYLKCVMENPNAEILLRFENGTLANSHKLLITFYPELVAVKYPISNLDLAYIQESLRILHSAGISHGDVHANNVMYNRETGTIVLIDWDGSTLNAKQDRFENDMHFFDNNLRSHNESVRRDVKRQEERDRRKEEVRKKEDDDDARPPKISRLNFE